MAATTKLLSRCLICHFVKFISGLDSVRHAGLASQELKHLRLVGSVVTIEPELYDWLMTKYAKALVASGNAVGKHNENNEFVYLPGLEMVLFNLSLSNAL